ncbi:IucA/IucC family siderophore biosynthesis protein [Ammoniphilus sp. 3BR4]|uniref:IucA/IucC family protein n=1 Tax=Ammoniphilus sp. 3BR4 TaxID=3158265 RepID=UPI0034657479
MKTDMLTGKTEEKGSALDVSEAVQSEQFVQVRRRIFRQLIESLIYEGVVSPKTAKSGPYLRFVLEGRDVQGNPVLYTCEGERRWTFDRIRLSDKPVMRTIHGIAEEAESLPQFLLEIRESLGAEDGKVAIFIHELQQTLFKDTLAQHRRHQENRTLRGGSYDELEGDIMDGHPYHPSYKSRIGFGYAENYAFGPEFKNRIQPIWVAVHQDWTRFSISKHLDYDQFILNEIGREQWESFKERVRNTGNDPEEYLLMPVHPWQWEKVISSSFIQDLRENRLIFLGAAGEAYRPQQSIRTMANVSSPMKSYLKLSMSIINTSTGRILAPHTVQNAPAISDWLQELVSADSFLKDELEVVLLGEILGLSYDYPAPSELLQSSTYGTLSCIWRESLHRFLKPGEEAVPFNALTSLDLDGKPFIEPWIRKEGAEEWLTRLFATSIIPIVHLLYAHGIAVESHAQNMVLIHRQGTPSRLALKDFHDGIRFSRKHLMNPENCPELLGTPEYHARVNRNSFIETDDIEAVRDFMHDAFFFINIGELALVMADYFGFEERKFWALARQTIESYQQRFSHLRERFELFDLFAHTIQVEQLTKRRLFPDTELRVHTVRNPLSYSVSEAVGGQS